jgi:tetratricopeptide (TPR) repeat protein
LEIVGALGEYWWRSGRWADGRRWVDAALDLPASAPPAVRARALLYRARLLGARHHERHREDLEASLALFRAGDDAAGVAVCLAHLAAVEAWAGNHEQATVLVNEAMNVAEAVHDEDALAFVLVQSAVTTASYERAAGRARTAIAHLERVGNLRQLGFVCNVVAYQAIAEGRYQDALDWLDQGFNASRRLGDLNLVYLIRGNQGLASLFLDNVAEAGHRFREALAVCREGGSEGIIDEELLGLAAASAKQGKFTLAAQLAGAARAHPAPGASPNESAIWSQLEEIISRARERVGPEDWDADERRGGALTVPEAIDLALARGRFAHKAPTTLASSGS